MSFGGSEMTSIGVLNEFSTIQRNGARKNARMRAMTVPRAIPLTDIGTGELGRRLAAQVRECEADRQHDREEDDQHGTRIAEAEIQERLLVCEDIQRFGRKARPAPGHRVDDVERLERVDEPEERRDDDRRYEKRQRDHTYRLQRRGAVDRRGLERLRWQAREAGERDEDDHRRP